VKDVLEVIQPSEFVADAKLEAVAGASDGVLGIGTSETGQTDTCFRSDK